MIIYARKKKKKKNKYDYKYGWRLYYIFIERNAGRCLLVLRKRETAIAARSSQWTSDTQL